MQNNGNDTNHFEQFELSQRQKASQMTGSEITKPLYAKASPATRLQRDVQNVAKKLGLDVTYIENTSNSFDGTEFNFNGAYKDGHIYINLNSENPLKVVFSHEVVHQIKDTDTDSYNKLVDIVRNELGADSGFDSLTELQQEEAIADIMGDILDNPSKYNAVFRQNQTLCQRILTVIRDMLNKLTGQNNSLDGDVSEYTSKLKNVENELTKVMTDAVGGLSSKTDVKYSGDTRYSIKKDNKGNEYWEIEPEKDIFKGLKTKDEYVDAAYNYLLNNRDNKVTVKDKNNKEITFIRLSAEEFTNSKESQELYNNSPDLLTKKMRMIPSLQDILLHSSVEWHSKDHKEHKLFKENGFDNYRGKVRVGNVIFNTVVRVGNAKFGNVFYDINLEVDTILPHTKGASEIKNVSTSTDNIPQNSNVVNTQYMQNSENDAKKSQKTSKLYDNTLQKPWTTQDTKKALEENKDRFMYDGITNKETYEAAKAEVESVGMEAAERSLYVKQDWDAVDTAMALNLISRYQGIGDHSKAVDVASVLRERMTKAGQEIQALRIVDKLTPEGQLIVPRRNGVSLMLINCMN